MRAPKYILLTSSIDCCLRWRHPLWFVVKVLHFFSFHAEPILSTYDLNRLICFLGFWNFEDKRAISASNSTCRLFRHLLMLKRSILIPLFTLSVVFIYKVYWKKTRNLNITQPGFTPVFTWNHCDVSFSSMTAHSNPLKLARCANALLYI